MTRIHAELAALLAVALAVHPLAIEAQQAGKVWRIGFISVAYMRIATKFKLVINLKTAKILGITIPQALLLRADEIIQ